MSTPAWSIETAVGAEEWPSGDHVCRGHSAARIPKPTKRIGKNIRWKRGSKAVFSSTSKSKECCPEAKYRPRIPARMSALPAMR